MGSETFNNALSSDFWQECARTMPPPCLAVVLDILHLLDTSGGETSVRSSFSSKGTYGRQGRITLLEHSISVARICGELAGEGIVQDLAMVAGLAHDCGKLPQLHPGKYAAVMHAHWGAVHLSKIIRPRLSNLQAAAVIGAVEKHHVAGSGSVLSILHEADRLAREREEQAVVAAAVSTPSKS